VFNVNDTDSIQIWFKLVLVCVVSNLKLVVIIKIKIKTTIAT